MQQLKLDNLTGFTVEHAKLVRSDSGNAPILSFELIGNLKSVDHRLVITANSDGDLKIRMLEQRETLKWGLD